MADGFRIAFASNAINTPLSCRSCAGSCSTPKRIFSSMSMRNPTSGILRRCVPWHVSSTRAARCTGASTARSTACSNCSGPPVTATTATSPFSRATPCRYAPAGRYTISSKRATRGSSRTMQPELHITELTQKMQWCHYPDRNDWIGRLPGYFRKRLYKRLRPGDNPYFRTLPPLEKGSNWIVVTDRFRDFVFDYLRTHPDYIRAFRHSHCGDEIFFQTLMGISEFAGANTRRPLVYTRWVGEGAPHPGNIRHRRPVPAAAGTGHGGGSSVPLRPQDRRRPGHRPLPGDVPPINPRCSPPMPAAISRHPLTVQASHPPRPLPSMQRRRFNLAGYNLLPYGRRIAGTRPAGTANGANRPAGRFRHSTESSFRPPSSQTTRTVRVPSIPMSMNFTA